MLQEYFFTDMQNLRSIFAVLITLNTSVLIDTVSLVIVQKAHQIFILQKEKVTKSKFMFAFDRFQTRIYVNIMK